MVDFIRQRQLELDRYDTIFSPRVPPDVGIFDAPTLMICLNRSWASFIDGALERLIWEDAWQGTENDKFLAIQEILKLMAALATGCCCCSCGTQLTRWTADGVLQISLDGGLTWQDYPQGDPRETGNTFPPLPGANGAVKRCAAAMNMVANMTSQIEQYADELDAAGNLTSLIATIGGAVVVFIGVTAPITAFLAVLASTLISVGASAVRAAFTQEVWDKLQCCIDCNISNDGSVSSAQITEIKACVDEEITGIANLLIKQMIDTLGAIGLTNEGRIGGADGDACDDCGCECITEETYSVQVENWTGGLEGVDGGCGEGRYFGDGQGGPATFTIPNRDDRLVVGVNFNICDGTLGASGTTTVSVGGVSSDESPQNGTPGWNIHTWAVGVDSDTIVINSDGIVWYFINGFEVIYEC